MTPNKHAQRSSRFPTSEDKVMPALTKSELSRGGPFSSEQGVFHSCLYLFTLCGPRIATSQTPLSTAATRAPNCGPCIIAVTYTFGKHTPSLMLRVLLKTAPYFYTCIQMHMKINCPLLFPCIHLTCPLSYSSLFSFSFYCFKNLFNIQVIRE